MDDVNDIDARTLRDWQARGEAMWIVDVRSPAEAARGVIPGAKAIPLHLLSLQAQVLAARLRDKNSKVVFYCQTGARSTQAACFMLQFIEGHQVYNLTRGLMGWVMEGRPMVEPPTQVALL